VTTVKYFKYLDIAYQVGKIAQECVFC